MRSGNRIKPVVAKILAHPALYANLDAPDMVKAPVVFVAGHLRALGRGIDDSSWTWLLSGMGRGARLLTVEHDPGRAAAASAVLAQDSRVRVLMGDWRLRCSK